MRKLFKYNIIGLALLAVGIISCDTASVDPEPIVEPDDSYPMVTYTLDNTGTIHEGDTIVYTVSLSAPITKSLTFTPVLNATTTTLVEHTDFELGEALTISPYETEGKFMIYSIADAIPEPVGTIAFKFEITSLAEKYLVHPNNTFPEVQFSVNPGLWLDIAFDWSSDDDLDFVIFKDEISPLGTGFSDHGGTLAQPEIDNSLKLSDVGTYWVSIMHWGAPAFDYTFTFGKPDATTQTVTGTFTSDNLKAYYLDTWLDWGDGYNAYRLLKIVNDGTSFTITKYDALTSADYVTTANLVGTWSGIDGALPDWGYATTTVDITDVDGDPYIYGLNEGWMTDFWGESITSGDPVEIIVYSNGNVVIPYSYYWTTDYDGDAYDYGIFGFGTYDATTGLHLEYEMDQDGFYCANWTLGNGYGDYPYFHADLTKAKQIVTGTNTKVPSFTKPSRVSSPKKEIIKK